MAWYLTAFLGGCVVLLLILLGCYVKRLRSRAVEMDFLRGISDEAYSKPFRGKKAYNYAVLLLEHTDNPVAVRRLLDSRLDELYHIDTVYNGLFVALLYGAAEETRFISLCEALVASLGNKPAYVLSPVYDDYRHINRMYREAKNEYTALRFCGMKPEVIQHRQDGRQGPLSTEPKELERKVFLKLVSSDFTGAVESFDALLGYIAHDDYRDLSVVKNKIFCILENAAYLLAFRVGLENDLSDCVPQYMGKFMLAESSEHLKDVGEQFIAMMEKQFAPTSQQSKILDDIIAHLNSNYSDCQLSITSVAQDFDILPQQLSRDFKAKFKISPSDYLQQQRLNRAKTLLLNTDYSNERIAELSGFGSVKAFYRAMNKSDNTTPSQFRRSDGGSMTQ